MPGILDPGDDVVLWAHRVGQDGGTADVSAKEGARVEWQVFVSSPTATYYDIVRSPKLPPLGEPLYEYAPPLLALGPHGYPVAESALYSYERGALLNSAVRVINYTCQQNKDNPFLWAVTVVYEGVTDPTAIAAEVSSEDVEYQDHEFLDVNGRVVANSAFDPVLGGMPVDHTYKIIRITRAVPFDLWNMKLAEPFKNTLNALPFQLSRQKEWVTVPDPDDPPDGTMQVQQDVFLPPGTVRIKKITEKEVVRGAAPDPADRLRHWLVTCELHVDLRTVRLPDGSLVPTLHRYVVADMGYQELDDDGIKRRIVMPGDATASIGPQLLDGEGHWIRPAPNPPSQNYLVAGPPDPEALAGTQDYYATVEAQPLTVAAPGVLANDPDGLAAGATAVLVAGPPGADTAAFTLNADGGFTFTSAASVAPKWVTFTYKIVNGGDESDPIACHILVNDLPRYLAFDRYRYADWTPLAALLANW